MAASQPQTSSKNPQHGQHKVSNGKNKDGVHLWMRERERDDVGMETRREAHN